jgi:hypothetical protein
VCQLKNASIKTRYRNPHFNQGVDHCMVSTLVKLNRLDYVATVASCCGHGGKNAIPYLTTLQPRSRIEEVKDLISTSLGWKHIRVFIWKDLPPESILQLGEFIKGKIYCGFYDMNIEGNSCGHNEEEWFSD